MTDAPTPQPGAARQDHRGHRRDPFRTIAAAVCLVQALALLGFCVFYLWELTQGASDDAVRVISSTVLIAVFGVALALLGRAWRRGDHWPNTPTVVWNVLLLPVSWSMAQSGHAGVAGLVAVVALLGIVAAVRARGEDDDSPAV